MADNQNTKVAAEYQHQEERVAEHSKVFKKELGLRSCLKTRSR